ITQRAGVALGTFYTYFDTKEAVFQALVRDMSNQVREHVAPAFEDAADAIDGERRALESFLQFARKHRDVYRIIDEAEFVEPSAYRNHYETTATRIAARLKSARKKGEIASDLTDRDLDILAWAIMGANVFLGLKFEVWSSADARRVADVTSRLLRKGLSA
ncbi:MAG TPA: TetR/AcrR family transcriptional regulator, partial [Sphingomicrobium sp.]|nr:TetR/AcrR family transcriptional regulator [Sphingomicrobium sp.]